MLKKLLVSGLVSLSIATSVSAYDLKTNMNILSSELAEVQRGFLTNDKKFTKESLKKLQKEVHDLLSDKENIAKMLPEKVRYKASIAVNAAKMMNDNIEEINRTLEDKNIRMIDRQKTTQRDFLNIQNQCFRCHNLVRDWE